VLSSDQRPLAACLLTAVTVALVLARPRGLPEGVGAALGAIAAVVLGVVPVQEAAGAVGSRWNVLLFFAGLMAVAGLADEAGVFAMVGRLAVGLARGSPARLYAAVIAAGAVVTAFLSNDATALLLTPVVATVAGRLELDPLPYALATSVIANAASGVLPVANPVNILVLDAFHVSLAEYLRVLLLPAVLTAAVSAALLGLAVRPRLAAGGAALRAAAVTAGGDAVRPVRGALPVLVLLAAAYLTATALRLPVGPVACVGGAALAVAVRRERPAGLARLRHDVSLSVLVLVAGLFVVVQGLETTGVTGHLVDAWLTPVEGRTHLGPAVALLGSALGSNLVNNLPMTLIAISGIHAIGGAHAGTLALAAGLGADVGPNLTPIGSLSTLLWLVLLRGRGVRVGGATYVRYGVVVTVPALLVAAAALALTAR
jgi:arsenical pump membrane protein